MATKQVTSLRMEKKFKKTPAGEIPVEWEVASLKDVCLKSQEQFDPLKNEKVPYVGLEHIDGTGKLFGVGESSDVKSLKTSFKTGSILFGKLRPYLRKVTMVDFDGVCSTDIMVIVPSQKVSSNFMLYALQSDAAINFAIGTSAGTKMPRTSWPLFSKFLFPLPPLPEQKKIAEILSAVAEAIEKTGAVIEKTKELKKGLMQQLLTRGLPARGAQAGIGHKKFKKTEIGAIPAGWEVVEAKSVALNFLNGGTPDTKIQDYWQGAIPWITGADIVDQKVANIRRKITEEAVKNSATNVVPKNALLIVTRTGVGKLAIAPFDIAVSQDITGVIPDTKKITSEFLFWYLDYSSNKLKSIHQGTSINGILREDLEAFQIPVPSLSEQNEVAEILSKIDADIDREKLFKQQLEQTKNSLMHVLLTGKIRMDFERREK